jgi:hypothetical protein
MRQAPNCGRADRAAALPDGELSPGALCMGPDAGNATPRSTGFRKLPALHRLRRRALRPGLLDVRWHRWPAADESAP